MLFIKNHKILKIVSLQHFSVVPNIDMILQNNTHNSLNSSMITFIISLRDLEMSKLSLIGLLTLSWIMKKIPIMIFSMLEKLMSPVSDSLICLIWVFNKRWHKKQLEKSFNKDQVSNQSESEKKIIINPNFLFNILPKLIIKSFQ